MMNLNYGDARSKNNSSRQNKLYKFTSNTYASSSINSPSSFPALTSSLFSNSYYSLERERERVCIEYDQDTPYIEILF